MIPLQTASRHPVSHIVFSPDGSTLAVAQPNYGVTILDRATGHTLAVCAMPRRAEFTGITFCGDGKCLAVASAKGLEIFDAGTGAPVAANYRSLYKNLRVAESGGDLLGASACGVRVVWKSEVSESPGFTHFLVSRLEVVDVISPGGRFAILGGSHSHELLLALNSHRMVARIKREERYGTTLVGFCPLGHRFALSNGELLDVYDAGELTEDEDEQPTDGTPGRWTNGTQVAVTPRPRVVLSPVFTLKPDNPAVVSGWYPPFALLADGRGLLVKRPRNRIQWWDAPTGTVLSEWSWRFEWVTCVAASGDGLTAVAGGRFGRVLLWDLG